MRPLVLMEIPGLTASMVADHAPRLRGLGAAGVTTTLEPDLPAVTMPGHASLMTGSKPSEHGIVANGYYDRVASEIKMWPQSERLMSGQTLWEAGKQRDAAFTCLKHFWWPGMASTADLHVNVRPVYHADGRKGGDIYTNRPGLSGELQSKHGPFPLFKFWGPGVDITATRWIADVAMDLVGREKPTLSLIYLPHLDYRQQTVGPEDPSIAQEIRDLDDVVGRILDQAKSLGAEVIALSGYGMVPVHRPVHLNRLLREGGWLKVLTNATGELIDFGQSQAVALCDHQVAHVYVQDASILNAVRDKLEATAGVARVLDDAGKRDAGLDHPRSGELVVLAEPDAWFTYYHWLDDAKAPDFARTVAIHAKYGYDPCEMLIDPALPAPGLTVAGKLAKKAVGMRYVMDVIPLDATLIKGSHGLVTTGSRAPVFLSSVSGLSQGPVKMAEVKNLALKAIFEA